MCHKISYLIRTIAHPDGTATIVIWRLPSKFASLGCDVRHFKGTLGPCWPAEHTELHPFLVEPVAILGSDFVLAGVPSQGVCAFKECVVVTVGDLDPLVGLVNEELLLLGDVAVPLRPGLVCDRLANDVNGPGHGFADLDRDDLQVVSYKPWFHCRKMEC